MSRLEQFAKNNQHNIVTNTLRSTIRSMSEIETNNMGDISNADPTTIESSPATSFLETPINSAALRSDLQLTTPESEVDILRSRVKEYGEKLAESPNWMELIKLRFDELAEEVTRVERLCLSNCKFELVPCVNEIRVALQSHEIDLRNRAQSERAPTSLPASPASDNMNPDDIPTSEQPENDCNRNSEGQGNDSVASLEARHNLLGVIDASRSNPEIDSFDVSNFKTHIEQLPEVICFMEKVKSIYHLEEELI